MDQTYASLGYVPQGGFVGGDPGLTKTEQSPLTMAGIALAQSQDICTRIEQLADRLLGPEPREVAGNAAYPPEQPFVLRALEQSSHMTLSRLSSAMRAIDRIERSLP